MYLPRLLTDERKQNGKAIPQEPLERVETDLDLESFAISFDSANSPRSRKAMQGRDRTNTKVVLIAFFDSPSRMDTSACCKSSKVSWSKTKLHAYALFHRND